MNDTDQRLDPDTLLERVQRAEAIRRRGRLKIFFGANAGRQDFRHAACRARTACRGTGCCGRLRIGNSTLPTQQNKLNCQRYFHCNLHELSLYPLASTSRMMDRTFLGDRHYRVAQTVREHLARYRELEDIIAMLGMEALSETDRRVVQRARLLERYLTQPFFVVAEHTGIAGASVPLETTLTDCEAFVRGDYDHLPEERCYMRGGMET